MASSTRLGWALTVHLGVCVLSAPAQIPAIADLPPLCVPLRPQTPAELNRREALARYGLGLLKQRGDRLVEATHEFEAAVKLDPQAVAVHRALIPLYLVLCRPEDALNACHKVLDLEPGDYQTWLQYGQQLRAQGLHKEARTALTRASMCAGLADHPDVQVQVYFDLGVSCEAVQEYAQAVDAFAQVVRILEKPELLLETGPYNAEQLKEQAANTYERMIKICIQSRQQDRAMQLFREAGGRYPALRTRLNYHLAKVAHAQGHLSEALSQLDDYLRTQPQGTEAYELKVALLTGLGRQRDIVPALQGHAQRDPHNTALHLLLAREYHRVGQSRQAEDLYRTLAKDTPSPEVYRGLLNLWKDQGRMDEALQMLDDQLAQSTRKDTVPGESEAAPRARALLALLREDASLVKALLPAVRPALLARNRLARETRFFLAVLAGRTHQLDEAEQLYRSCLSNGRAHPQIEVAVYDGLLRVLWEGRKYDAIVSLCQQGLEHARVTNRLMFHINASRALGLLGNLDESLAQADKAVELADDDSRLFTRLNRVRMLRHAEHFERAIAECQALLQEFTLPSAVRDIRYELSHCYSLKRDFPQAEEQLQLILSADANDATANNDLGYLLADQGKDLEEAERLIRKAIELDKQQKKTGMNVSADDDRENAAYIDSLGWVLFRRGQLDAARQWLEKAAALPGGEDDPVVWDHLGDVCFRLEQPARARTAWERARVLYETDKRRKADEQYRELKQKLELLRSENR